jgi:transposase-like protein
VSRKARGKVHARLREIFNAPDRERALDRVHRLMEELRDFFPKFGYWLEETIEEPLTVFTLPEKHSQ